LFTRLNLFSKVSLAFHPLVTEPPALATTIAGRSSLSLGLSHSRRRASGVWWQSGGLRRWRSFAGLAVAAPFVLLLF
ncbi:hypothetical protein A2U01_0085697, partial [Trifolium medium]|nr:hypothetical protein [Trifolium medium]